VLRRTTDPAGRPLSSRLPGGRPADAGIESVVARSDVAASPEVPGEGVCDDRRMDEHEPASIRVLIADDHPIVRSGLRLLLDAEPDMVVVGEAGTGAEAVLRSTLLDPDVVLMDVVMPGENGVDATRRLVAELPGVKVLVLSMQDDARYVREAFDAGARGYVLKDAADVEVVHAVRDVAAGGRYVNPALGARLAAAPVAAHRRAATDPPSAREREVLRLLAHGYTNQEISHRLYLSVRTVETHRAHIMRKLGVHSRAELVSYALAQGLLAAAS
jgi:DNA-binding NarL/FixJ family response regulator